MDWIFIDMNIDDSFIVNNAWLVVKEVFQFKKVDYNLCSDANVHMKITDNRGILPKYDIWIFLLRKLNKGCMHDTTRKDLTIYTILVKVRMLQRIVHS